MDYRAYVEYNQNEIYHFGVKGMKWGVRRYQDYDGTYTQKGLARYRKAEADYDKAESDYKTHKSSGNEQGARQAKDRMKFAERNMRKEYKDLKRHKMADEGKKLYRSGNTIGTYATASKIFGSVFTLSGTAAAALIKNGDSLASKYGSQKINNAKRIAVGATAVSGLLAAGSGVLTYDRSKKLRAYYAH